MTHFQRKSATSTSMVEELLIPWGLSTIMGV